MIDGIRAGQAWRRFVESFCLARPSDMAASSEK
jgi:hypothetical protein